MTATNTLEESGVAIVVCALILLATLLIVVPRVQATAGPTALSEFGELSAHLDPRKFVSPNPQSNGWFGASVSVSGQLIVIGAPYETVSGNDYAGHAYVFNRLTGSLVSALTSPNSQALGYFGASVGISGMIVVVGAWGETAAGYEDAGHAYLFNAINGSLISTLTSPMAQTSGYFGYSVAISGSRVVVGAEGEAVSGYTCAGRAYVFEAKTGSFIRGFETPNPQTCGGFGYSVGISGATVAVGAPLETVNGDQEAGHVYIYKATTGALLWTLVSPNLQSDGIFGLSVAVSGSTIAIGAPDETVSGASFAGRAYLFDGATGGLYFELASPNPQGDGGFGWSVALDGGTVVVGAPDYSVSGHYGAGIVYVFDQATGMLTLTLLSPKAHGEFGVAVAIAGQHLIIGAYQEKVHGITSGAAYAFNL